MGVLYNFGLVNFSLRRIPEAPEALRALRLAAGGGPEVGGGCDLAYVRPRVIRNACANFQLNRTKTLGRIR